MDRRSINAKMYHGQAEVDEFAKRPDTTPSIIETTLKAIEEAYTEFMQDLMLEAQEAY